MNNLSKYDKYIVVKSDDIHSDFTSLFLRINKSIVKVYLDTFDKIKQTYSGYTYSGYTILKFFILVFQRKDNKNVIEMKLLSFPTIYDDYDLFWINFCNYFIVELSREVMTINDIILNKPLIYNNKKYYDYQLNEITQSDYENFVVMSIQSLFFENGLILATMFSENLKNHNIFIQNDFFNMVFDEYNKIPKLFYPYLKICAENLMKSKNGKEYIEAKNILEILHLRNHICFVEK